MTKPEDMTRKELRQKARKKELMQMTKPEIRNRMAQLKRDVGQLTPTVAFLMTRKQLAPYEAMAEEFAELKGELERRKKAEARGKAKRRAKKEKQRQNEERSTATTF